MVVLKNCGELESNNAIEYSEAFECMNFPPSPTYFPPLPTTFPPSPPYFPLHSSPSPPRPSSSNSGVIYVWDSVLCVFEQQDELPNFYLALLVEYKIQDRGGALDVIPAGRIVKINELIDRHDDIVHSRAKNIASEYIHNDWEDILPHPDWFQEFEDLEKQNDDIVDQLVVDSVSVVQHLIQYSDGALHDIDAGLFSRINGSELTQGQLLTSTPEPALIFQTKFSLRVWQGHRDQWVVDFCYGWNWLNIGTLKTAKGAPFSSESVVRYRGGKDLFDYPFSELFVKENRAEPTTAPRTEIQTPELSPAEEQEKPDEDLNWGAARPLGMMELRAEATRNDGVEAVGIGGCNGCEGTPIQVQQENPDEDLGNDEVDDTGIGGEGTKEGEIAEAQLNSGTFGKRKRKEKTPRGGRANKKTTPIRNYISLEKILQVKKMRITEAAEYLKVTPSAMRCACREHGINRWPPRNKHEGITQSLLNETPAVVDQVGIPKLASKTLPSDQALMATVDANSSAEETALQQFSPTVQLENPDEDSDNDELEAVGTGESEIRRNEKAPGGKRDGVRIKIPLEEILKYKNMRIEDVARELKVSRSTLKRICREYNISRWPPLDEHKHIGQSHPTESPAIVDQEPIPHLNSNVPLPANQVLATIDTHSVIVRANHEDVRIKFRLSWPWRMVELEQEVKKRLQFKTGTYYIKYKDEDDGMTLIACDEDLKDCISSSSPLGTHSIEVFLSQKVAHEVRVDQL